MADEALAFAARKAGHALPDGWNAPGQPLLPLLDGPSIVDVNTGFARHSRLGLQGLYRDLSKQRKPTKERFVLNQRHRELYQLAGSALETMLTTEFGLSELHFSAPTFVARLQGSSEWQARDIHDEYWHPHVDRNNTAHYHYSALLYLAEGGGKDFSGGEFQFMDADSNFTVVPRAGRVVIFTSGQEHLHRVRPVTDGVRYAISMWFTCDASMAMPQFLDGQMHNTFHAKRQASLKRQRRHVAPGHRIKASRDEFTAEGRCPSRPDTSQQQMDSDSPVASMEELMSFCRSRAIILDSSGVYGGAATTYDFGPVGAQLKKNIIDMWWRDFVENRDDVAPLDTGIILNPAVWRGSGHVEEFTDPLTQCESCKRRFRADKLLEEADGGTEHWDGKSLEEMGAALLALGVACPSCGAKGEAGLGTPRPFNLLFETSIGPVQDGTSTAFLRPETAQGALVQGPLVLSLTRARLPAGLAQVGKSFRNEIAVGQSLFRTREFEQAEIQVFCNPEGSGELLQQWVEDCNGWLVDRLGLSPSRIRRRVHEESELAHYALATTDIEFNYPFGWGELWGIANRGKYDLLRHEAASGQDMRYRDPRDGGKTAFHPFVVEPALGVGRLVLAVLSDCLVTEAAPAPVEGKKQQAGRLVLRVPDEIAPSRAAVLPLMNKDGMPERAAEIAAALRRMGAGGIQVDTSGSIGKRYRRQDEVGTPLCVTVDYTTLEDGTVTVRCRDTMRQARVSLADVEGAVGPRGLTRDKLQAAFDASGR